MKKFIIRFIYFFIITFIIALLFDFFISYRLYMCSNERKYQEWRSLYKNQLTADLIILGNSRAGTQYNPIILDSILHTNSFVNGINGSAINRQMLKYQNYIRISNQKPKLILQNIDLLTMTITYGYEREQFFPYFIIDRKLVQSYQIYENWNILELYIPCYRYIGYPNEIKKSLGLHAEYPEPLFKGYYGRDTQYDGSELRKMTQVVASLDSTMLIKFDNFCADLKSDSISMCFVYAPIYIEATKKMTNLKEMYNAYQSIAKKHNIPILDYNFHAISCDSTNFYNATHLNKKGSILFSTQLSHDLDSLGILLK